MNDPVILLAYIFPIANAIKTRSCVRFLAISILQVANNFSSNAKNQRAKLIFSKKAKMPLFYCTSDSSLQEFSHSG